MYKSYYSRKVFALLNDHPRKRASETIINSRMWSNLLIFYKAKIWSDNSTCAFDQI